MLIDKERCSADELDKEHTTVAFTPERYNQVVKELHRMDDYLATRAEEIDVGAPTPTAPDDPGCNYSGRWSTPKEFLR